MKKMIYSVGFFAILLWCISFVILLGIYRPAWLPGLFLQLELPKSTADFGQSFSVFDGLLSSLALVLGLAAFIIQIRQNTDANVIGAFAVRQQFLFSECDRLEGSIQSLKNSDKYDPILFNNMVDKKKKLLLSCKLIDAKLEDLLAKM